MGSHCRKAMENHRKRTELINTWTHGLPEAGCDEAGRGCLAGPVFAAAVILPEKLCLPGLNDSKKLSQGERNNLRTAIEAYALAWAVASVSPEEIDRTNILRASIRAMHLALEALSVRPGHILVDGNRFFSYPGIHHRCEIRGDGRFACIAAASVLAKTNRDGYMENLHSSHPEYHWKQNKGYPTAAHRTALQRFGPSPHHRRSFRLLPHPQLFS